MVTGTISSSPEQEQPVITSHIDNHSDEVLELLKESEEDTRTSGAPASGEGALWTAKPEELAPAAITETPMEVQAAEAVMASPSSEPAIEMDSMFTSPAETRPNGIPAQTRVETTAAQNDLSKYADNELRAAGEAPQDDPFDVKLDMPVAEGIARDVADKGYHVREPQIPEFHRAENARVEAGARTANEHLRQSSMEIFESHLEEIDDRINETRTALEEVKRTSGEKVDSKKAEKQAALDQVEAAETEIITIQNEASEKTGVLQSKLNDLIKAREVVAEAQKRLGELNLE